MKVHKPERSRPGMISTTLRLLRKPAVCANGVRVFAKIADNLHQAPRLLVPVPFKMRALDAGANAGAPASTASCPPPAWPREGNAAPPRAKAWRCRPSRARIRLRHGRTTFTASPSSARFAQQRRFERPVLRPEFIALHLENFMERRQQFAPGNFGHAPRFPASRPRCQTLRQCDASASRRRG